MNNEPCQFIPPRRLLRDILTKSIQYSLDQGSLAPVIRENVLYAISRYEDDSQKIVFVEKNGWPIEWIKTRPISSFIRRLIHTRKIYRYENYYQEFGREIDFIN